MEWEESYLRALRPFFHAVATAKELDELGVDEYGTPKVLGRELLGERLVLARLDGEIVCLHGTCPHRGADLGLGWLSADGCNVVCRYHGFEWGADGRIARIPALEAAGKPLPTGAGWRVERHPTVVRYGLVWVCLEQEPQLPLLDVPEADNPEHLTLVRPPQEWHANCGRMVEASLDTYHFAFTHRTSIGDPGYPDAPVTDVTAADDHYLIQYDIDQPDTPMINYGTDAVEEARATTVTFVTSHYDFYAVPSGIHMIKTTGGVRFATLLAMCPIDAHRTTAYRIIFPHRDWDVDHEQFQRIEDAIFAEDRLVVESQRPWELKTDLDAELHALMDRPTVGYRRWLSAMGIEYS